jgi:hypothetical protein
MWNFSTEKVVGHILIIPFLGTYLLSDRLKLKGKSNPSKWEPVDFSKYVSSRPSANTISGGNQMMSRLQSQAACLSLKDECGQPGKVTAFGCVRQVRRGVSEPVLDQ